MLNLLPKVYNLYKTKLWLICLFSCLDSVIGKGVLRGIYGSQYEHGVIRGHGHGDMLQNVSVKPNCLMVFYNNVLWKDFKSGVTKATCCGSMKSTLFIMGTAVFSLFEFRQLWNKCQFQKTLFVLLCSHVKDCLETEFIRRLWMLIIC